MPPSYEREENELREGGEGVRDEVGREGKKGEKGRRREEERKGIEYPVRKLAA
jgi:hypothetical protein